MTSQRQNAELPLCDASWTFRHLFARDQQSAQFAVQVIENQLHQALSFIQASVTPTDAQRLANPSVLHADFSTFRGYGPGGCE